MADVKTVAVAGLGSIGLRIAEALDKGMDGLKLVAVSARDITHAKERLRGFRSMPEVLPISALPDAADIIVECLPPSAFDALADAVLAKPGSMLIVASVGRLLTAGDFLSRAKKAGIRIIVPSGAIAGLDGLRAAKEIGLDRVTLKTSKPPLSFGKEIQIAGATFRTRDMTEATLIFSGNALDCVVAFPQNINVAATVALAGLGTQETKVEIWADPQLSVNTHELTIYSRGGKVTTVCENIPDENNPKSSAITAYSIIATLRHLDSDVSICA